MLLCNALPGAVIPMTVALLQVGLASGLALLGFKGQGMQCFHHKKQTLMLCCLASAAGDDRQHLRPITAESSIEPSLLHCKPRQSQMACSSQGQL